MKLHILKIKQEYYNDIINGFKTFEVRKNDRDFQIDDIVVFRIPYKTIENPYSLMKETIFSENPTNKVFRITYLLKNIEEYGLDKDYCIFGIKEIK